MSSGALIGLVAGVALLLLAMVAVLIWDSRTPAADRIADPVELQRWDAKAQQAADDFGLAATRAAAGKWGASTAAILGVLSTVAVVAGPSNLVTDVGGTEADIAAALVLAAAGVAALATLLAGLAEQGSPVKGVVTPGGLRALTRVRAERAAQQIRWSRVLTAVALVLIVAAAGVAWLTALTRPVKAAVRSAIVVTGGAAKCGILTVSKTGGLIVTVSGTPEQVPGGAQVTLVDSCPT